MLPPASTNPSPHRWQISLRIAASLAALTLLGMVGTPLRTQLRLAGPTPASLDDATWEGRRLLAQLLWAKTHAVLHSGVEERPEGPDEAGVHAEHHHTHEGSAEHDHELMIPSRREDFRGILGDLERAVKPYLNSEGRIPGTASDQTLPLYRLMTWADPHYIQAYTVGASFINDAGKHTADALAFLREGERNNPDSFEIQTELGHYSLVYQQDYAVAENYLLRALELVPRHRKLNELEQDTLVDTFRWLVLTYVQSKQPEAAVRAAEHGIRTIGPDVTLVEVLERRGHQASPSAK